MKLPSIWLDTHVPGNRDQPQCASGQLRASQRIFEAGFCRHRLDALRERRGEVNSKRGSIAIEAEFGDLQKPTTFGNEYLTYVLWAISPEGRAVNLGEVLVGGNHRSKLLVTTDLQAFALIVTAEPYYAVRQPSNVVILENVSSRRHQGNDRSGKREIRTDGTWRLHPHGLQV
jgi:hypothetical protein